MDILFAIPSFLTGISIVLLPLITSFAPQLGLVPLKLGHRRLTRLLQIITVWLLALGSLLIQISAWGWGALAVAPLFTLMAAAFYPHRVFVALEQPSRSQNGLSDAAPVLMVELVEQVVAYPLELIVPHHLINDILGNIPILASY